MSNRITRGITSSMFITYSGDPKHVLYEPRFNGSSVVLREVGCEDIQERIEAFAPYTDLNYMLSRLKVGDTSVLNPRQAMYGDFTGLPTNAIDAINLIQTAESRFLELPAEDRQKFNNDFRVWLASMLRPASSVSHSKADNQDGSGPDVEQPVVQIEKE